MYYTKHMTNNKVLCDASAKMAEKDQLECRILSELFSDSYINENFVFAGGGTISKSYRFSPRIGQDIDLACADFTEIPDDRSKKRLGNFRKQFKNFVFDVLRPKINYIINQDQRFLIVTDREWRSLINQEQWLSSPTLHVLYKSAHDAGTHDVCIEIIPRKYRPSAVSYQSVVPYSTGTPLASIPTVAYDQTFWDKIFALHSNSQTTRPHFDHFYSRHYYDVATLAPMVTLADTQYMLSDIAQYQARYTTRGINPAIKPQDIRLLPGDSTLYKLENDYQKMTAETFSGAAESWDAIVQKLQALNQDLKTL